MTTPECQGCKYYYPYPSDKYDGICRYDPHFEWRKQASWCGKFKSNAKRRVTKNNVDYSDDFKAFYEAYPKKISPDVAWRAWCNKVTVPPEHYQIIIKRAKSFAEYVVSEAKDMQYVKHPATWLNAGDWKEKHEKKAGDKDCIDCGAGYAEGHKYGMNSRTNIKEYRCVKCRKVEK